MLIQSRHTHLTLTFSCIHTHSETAAAAQMGQAAGKPFGPAAAAVVGRPLGCNTGWEKEDRRELGGYPCVYVCVHARASARLATYKTHSQHVHTFTPLFCSQPATFAAGCFWGVELSFQRVPGVVSTRWVNVFVFVCVCVQDSMCVGPSKPPPSKRLYQ